MKIECEINHLSGVRANSFDVSPSADASNLERCFLLLASIGVNCVPILCELVT